VQEGILRCKTIPHSGSMNIIHYPVKGGIPISDSACELPAELPPMLHNGKKLTPEQLLNENPCFKMTFMTLHNR
jgi:hypothetical protein